MCWASFAYVARNKHQVLVHVPSTPSRHYTLRNSLTLVLATCNLQNMLHLKCACSDASVHMSCHPVQVFKGRLHFPDLPQLGMMQQRWLAPREVVVEQTWSCNEEDGIFNLSWASVTHPLAPEPPLSVFALLFDWWSPVRANVCPSTSIALPMCV
jgi:hypothetical protein